jgi:hypothetical protein
MEAQAATNGLRISRLVFGVVFTALGIWASARVILQLDEIHAAWPEWLALMFPALPLALGISVLVAAVKNTPIERRPFLRQRTGAARVFGSVTAGFFLISILLHHLSRQKTLGGVLWELSIAAFLIGIYALVFGAINADARERQEPVPPIK